MLLAKTMTVNFNFLKLLDRTLLSFFCM